MEKKRGHIINEDRMLALEVNVFDICTSSSELPSKHDPSPTDYLGRKPKQLPTLQVFGYSQEGRLTCLHIHGYFPYFYIKLSSECEPLFKDYQYIQAFGNALEIAVKKCTPRFSKRCIVRDMRLEKRLDFYGYNNKKTLFLKISTYSENIKKLLWRILEQGIVGETKWQVYEAHIGIHLQFFSDCTLHGFAKLIPSKCTLRAWPAQIVKVVKHNIDKGYLHSGQSDCMFDFKYNRLKKITTCEVEADCYFKSLLNLMEKKTEILASTLKAHFPSKLSKDLYDRRLVKWRVQLSNTLNNFWEEEDLRRKSEFLPTLYPWIIDLTKNIDSSIREVDLLRENNRIEAHSPLLLSSIRVYKQQSVKSTKLSKSQISINETQAKYWKLIQDDLEHACRIAVKQRFQGYDDRRKNEKKRQKVVDSLQSECQGSDDEKIDNLLLINKKRVKYLYTRDQNRKIQHKLDKYFDEFSRIRENRASLEIDSQHFEHEHKLRNIRVKNSNKNKFFEFSYKVPTKETIKNELLQSDSIVFYQ